MVVHAPSAQIVRYPDPRLRRESLPIRAFDASVADLARRMLDLMHAGRGVGLAGPQVGVCRRIIVCNPTGEPDDDMILINPVLSDLVGSVEAEEGCLSLPDVLVKVRRARKCHVHACDVTGTPFTLEAQDLLARIWQHEVDHLDGQLIIDRMDGTDRIANRKLIADIEARYRQQHRKR